MRANIELLNMDCMKYMAGCADKCFDLAIVDPPYGIGDFQTTGDANFYMKRKEKQYGNPLKWNKETPTDEYFEELKRVSKHRIIWGANYYNCFGKLGGGIVWDKRMTGNRYSDCEIASCTFHKRLVTFRFRWAGFIQENMKEKEVRIHSCQKPVQLYKWLLQNYAKPGDKILDTHLGSGSIAIACWDMCFDLVGMEIDKDYYNAAVARLERHKAQGQLF